MHNANDYIGFELEINLVITMKNVYKLILQIGIILGFLGTVIVNALATTLPLNGKDTGELSDNIPNLFVPSGLTFAVWGVIYLGLATLTIYSIRNLFQKETEAPEYIEKMGIEFIVTAIANITWIFLWHYELVNLSLIAMVVLLAALLTMYLRLKIGKSDAPKGEKWFVHVPISIYLGWITIATVANVTAVLVVNNWNRFGASEEFWAILMISIATLITLAMLFLRKDIAYSLVVIWALLGILLKRIDDAVIQIDGTQAGIVITTAVGMGLITALIGYASYKLLKKE